MGAAIHDFAQAKGFIAPPGYRRHQPEATLLYQLVAEHYPAFRAERAAEGRRLPRYVDEEFEAYLKCGRLEHGFLRVRCESCHPGSVSISTKGSVSLSESATALALNAG